MRIAIASLLVATAAHAGNPDDNARKVLDAQLSLLRHATDAQQRAMYDKDTVLLSDHGAATVGDTPEDYVKLVQIFGSVQVDDARIDTIAAGGGDGVVWFDASVTLAMSGAAEGVGEFKNTGKARVSQLAVSAGSGWKVVASIFDWGGPPNHGAPQPIGGATPAGQLAPLLASPKALADALATDPHVFVVGTEKSERAIGPAAAKKLLASWSQLKLSVEGPVREVETKTYGFAQAHVKWTKGKDTYWMHALIIAVPAASGWRVVGVHYAAAAQ
jgi:hypothetical protein